MKIAIVVLSVNTGRIYPRFKKVWKMYDTVHPHVDVFYNYGRIDNPFYKEHCDLVFDDVEECKVIHDSEGNICQGMLNKTIRSYEWLLKHGNYDYVIRTNLSTFWNIPKAFDRISAFPREKLFSGMLRIFNGLVRQGPSGKYKISGTYVSGTDQVISIDLVKKLVENYDRLLEINLTEDWAVSSFITKDLGIAPVVDNTQFRIEDLRTAQDLIALKPNIPVGKYDHYRIKNTHNRELDIELARHLYTMFYG